METPPIRYADRLRDTLEAGTAPIRVVGLGYVGLSSRALASSHCVVIVTDHRSFDYAGIAREASLIVDVRNALRDVRKHRGKIITL